jgi:hypothetical protein
MDRILKAKGGTCGAGGLYCVNLEFLLLLRNRKSAVQSRNFTGHFPPRRAADLARRLGAPATRGFRQWTINARRAFALARKSAILVAVAPIPIGMSAS